MPENTQDQPPQKQLAETPKREVRVVEDASALSYLLDTGRFEHMARIAGMMAGASLIPEHMWKDKSGPLPEAMIRANCFLVVNQALRWGFDPFAVVPETYVVGGKLGFQGKLIAAVINAKAPIKAPLDYTFSGTMGKDDFTITVSATLKSEDKPRTVTLSIGQAKTDNKMWTKDPEQKLVYSGSTRWARRHCPEIILGVVTDDDLERMASEAPTLPAPRAPKPSDPAKEKVVSGKETTLRKEPANEVTRSEPEREATTASNTSPASQGISAEEGKQIEREEAERAIREQLADGDPEKALTLLMALDDITVDELKTAFLAFNIRIPRDFDGPGSLTKKTIMETMEPKIWSLFLLHIKNKVRTQAAP